MTEDPAAALWSRLGDGDRHAAAELLPQVYERLRALAAGLVGRSRPDPLLQPTMLVHEAYAQLAGGKDVGWRSRTQFLAIAAKAMRDVLVDQARRARAQKRGGDDSWQRITASDLCDDRAQVDLDVLALHECLDRLAALDPRAAEIVQMRFFGGLSGDEIALATGLSRATVVRELTAARAWLARALGESPRESE
ncbi:MAG: ECF-type sigma factor [Planctomycetota bacterium]